MLKITNLEKTFNPGTVNAKTALSGLDLHLADGDFVTVIGGNGAGKSTLLNAIAGVWKPDFGTIEIDGVDVTGMPEYKRAAFLGRVFQDPMMGTAPDMEIAENLAIASKRGIRRRFVQGVRKADREYYRELLKTLDLRNPANNRPYGWATVKNILTDNDYAITESRSNNLRYSVIDPAADG